MDKILDGTAFEDSLGGLPDFGPTMHAAADQKACDCEMPLAERVGNGALGVVVWVNICCLAKEVEKLTGKSLLHVVETKPQWVWDCDDVVPVYGAGNKIVIEAYKPSACDHDWVEKDKTPRCSKCGMLGHAKLTRRGPPPSYLLKRFKERGIPIRNLR